MSNELAVQEVNPMLILQQAVAQGADIEKVAGLMMSLQERWDINQDKKMFRTAMVLFKQNPPEIDKDCYVEFPTSKGTTKYSHASLGNVTKKIGKALSDVGISHAWIPTQNGNQITITCTLSLGLYSESASLTAMADDSGGKNSIQAVISTKSYLERHTLTGITGMATNEAETDGVIPQPAFDTVPWVDSIMGAADSEALTERYLLALTAAKGHKKEVEILERTRNNRAKELKQREFAMWDDALNECKSLEEWNKYIIPEMKSRSKDFIFQAGKVAKERGWIPNKATGLYEEAK